MRTARSVGARHVARSITAASSRSSIDASPSASAGSSSEPMWTTPGRGSCGMSSSSALQTSIGRFARGERVQPLPAGELPSNPEATGERTARRDAIDLAADEQLLHVVGSHPQPHPRPSERAPRAIDQAAGRTGIVGPEPCDRPDLEEAAQHGQGRSMRQGERRGSAPPTPRCRRSGDRAATSTSTSASAAVSSVAAAARLARHRAIGRHGRPLPVGRAPDGDSTPFDAVRSRRRGSPSSTSITTRWPASVSRAPRRRGQHPLGSDVARDDRDRGHVNRRAPLGSPSMPEGAEHR